MNPDLFSALFSVALDGIAMAVVGCPKRDQVDKAEDLQVISYDKSCAFSLFISAVVATRACLFSARAS